MEAEQQQPIQQNVGVPYSIGTPIDQFGSNVTRLTNPDRVVDDIENTLRGVKKIRGQHIRFREKPYMNETGINDVMSLVKSHVAQNTVLSNLDNQQISSIMKLLNYTLAKTLMIKRKKYDIESSEDRTMIMDIILVPCYICLRRSYEQGERRFLKGAVYENVMSYPEQSNKKGLNTFLHPFGGK